LVHDFLVYPFGGAIPAGATPAANEPAPAVVRQEAPVRGHLQIGDEVEYDEFSNGAWGKFGTITSLNGDPNGACPSYYVKDAVSGLNISYVCSRVRYDQAAGRLSFTGGFLGRMNATGEFFGGKLSQIDISPAGGVTSSCSLQ
jgi:hypothetical protein